MKKLTAVFILAFIHLTSSASFNIGKDYVNFTSHGVNYKLPLPVKNCYVCNSAEHPGCGSGVTAGAKFLQKCSICYKIVSETGYQRGCGGCPSKNKPGENCSSCFMQDYCNGPMSFDFYDFPTPMIHIEKDVNPVIELYIIVRVIIIAVLLLSSSVACCIKCCCKKSEARPELDPLISPPIVLKFHEEPPNSNIREIV